jgi:hypothetical protein
VELALAQPNLIVRTTLETALGENCGPEVYFINGLVKGAEETSRLWVKMVPLIGSEALEAPVGKHGNYLIAGVRSEQYLLIVMDGETPIHIQRIHASNGKRFDIDLSNARPLGAKQ